MQRTIAPILKKERNTTQEHIFNVNIVTCSKSILKLKATSLKNKVFEIST